MHVGTRTGGHAVSLVRNANHQGADGCENRRSCGEPGSEREPPGCRRVREPAAVPRAWFGTRTYRTEEHACAVGFLRNRDARISDPCGETEGTLRVRMSGGPIGPNRPARVSPRATGPTLGLRCAAGRCSGSPRLMVRDTIPTTRRFTGRASGVTCTQLLGRACDDPGDPAIRLPGYVRICPDMSGYVRNAYRYGDAAVRGTPGGSGMSGYPVVRRSGGTPGCSGMSGGAAVRRTPGGSGMVGYPTDTAMRWTPYGLGCSGIRWCGGAVGPPAAPGCPTVRRSGIHPTGWEPAQRLASGAPLAALHDQHG